MKPDADTRVDAALMTFDAILEALGNRQDTKRACELVRVMKIKLELEWNLMCQGALQDEKSC